MERFRRGDIVWVELNNHACGSVQKGNRPCLIVSCNQNNRNATTLNVIPGTTADQKDEFPVHLSIEPSDVAGGNNIQRKTTFMCEQIQTVDVCQVIMKSGYIREESEIMERINDMIRRQLAI